VPKDQVHAGCEGNAAQERRERDPAEILPLRQLRQLAHDEFKIVAERGEVGARLIRGAQRQIVSASRLFQRFH
jgi:hypothetical protein